MLTFSDKIKHFFHIVSNIRPIVWIGLYVCLTPIFATLYWILPDGQFRIPDNAGTDWGSWLYYSVVTITTLGFGDYTPAHGWAQAITAIEVMCGLVFLGFFLNAVGSMKSEIDVESEIEKQRRLHFSMEKDKLLKSIPSILHSINLFLDYCYVVTTPVDKRKEDEDYNPEFKFNDLRDLFKPADLSFDKTDIPAVVRLVKCATHTSLTLDSLQSRVDLSLWPDVLENCFGFVAAYQIFSNSDILFSDPRHIVSSDSENFKETEKNLSKEIAEWNENTNPSLNSDLKPIVELYYFIKENADFASKIETELTSILKS